MTNVTKAEDAAWARIAEQVDELDQMVTQTVIKACDIGDMLREKRAELTAEKFEREVSLKLSRGRDWARQMIDLSFKRQTVQAALANDDAPDSVSGMHKHIKALPRSPEEEAERKSWPQEKRGPKKGSPKAGRPPNDPAPAAPKKEADPMPPPPKLDPVEDVFSRLPRRDQNVLEKHMKKVTEQVRKQAEAAAEASLKATRERLAQREQQVRTRLANLDKARAQVLDPFTQEEFKLIRGMLHPDRHPGKEDRARKAFDTFSRIEAVCHRRPKKAG